MTKKEALKYFAEYLKKPCPDCDTPAGKLCDTSAVWVHIGRIKLVQENKNG